MILDLSRTAYLGPDWLGALVHRMTMMKRQSQQLWLAALPGHVRRLLRSAHLEHCFAISPNVADAAYRIEKSERMAPSELIAARSFSPEARSMASVQMENLQDLCDRIGSVSRNC